MTTFIIQHIRPWSEFNEYEGQLEGFFGDDWLTVYVQIYSAEEWRALVPGNRLEGEVWLERHGVVEVLAGPVAPALTQQRGVNYELIGQVMSIEGEQVQLDSVFPLRVDMDWPVKGREQFPVFGVGDWLKVVGVLRLSLDDEEE
jgi:hypothetical protein